MDRRSLPSLLLVLLLAFTAFAQDPQTDEVEREKAKAERRVKMIAAIADDAAELKLPENRAYVNAKVGAAAWRTDEELARKLFRTAVNDLIAAQQAAEASKDTSKYYDLLNSQNVRPQIMNTIGALDAELALDALYRSRPAAVERALAAVSGGKSGGTIGNQPYIAQQEINLEQRLVKLAIEQKPDKAIALAKETVKKKLSGETLNLLQKIHQKEPAAATELANDVITRLTSTDLFKNNQPNYELLNLTTTLIAEHVKERQPEEKYIAFDDARVRRLAEKIFALYIANGPQMGWVPFQQLEPAVKKFSPASYEPLKKAATSGYRGHGMVVPEPELRKLLESNPTPEALVAAAKNFSEPNTRRELYQNAANKYSEGGQYQAGVALLNEKLEGEELENAVSSMNWYYAHHLLQKGQYDAAEAVMLEFNESNRVSALISLASSVYNANREENRTRALGILNRVRGMLPDEPENQNQMSQMFSLIGATTEMDAAAAASMLEPMVDQINRLIEAFTVVNAFQGGTVVRQGEYVMASGFSLGVYLDPGMVQRIFAKEPDRAVRIIDAFNRREVRILFRLSLLEGLN